MSSETVTSTTPAAPVQKRPSARDMLRRLLGGEQSQWPVLITLVIIAVFFQFTTKGLFLTPRNLSNLMLQIATIGSLGLAAVLVLLIGEIDLSLASVAYATADVTVVLSVRQHWSTVPAILAGLVAAIVIGLAYGFFIAVLRVPSFIVTLAGYLFFWGLAIHLLLPQTDIIIGDPGINNLATEYLPFYIGFGLPLVAVVIYAVGLLINRRRRQQLKLDTPPMWETFGRIVVTAVLALGTVALFEAYLGVPQSTMILMGLVVLFWLIMRFTSFGRHVYAVGGNAEAARRAGINVTRVRIAIFVLAELLAFTGGILLASRQGVGSQAVDQTLVLNAIATAVIGGVSLFGGRGSVWAVVLGSLVIGGLVNGLYLLGQNTDVVYMIEGAVLIVAVTADALTRRRSVTAR